MMKLERLRIDKFRNVKPGSDIRFADGFNIVLGRNGTGKTTLLDLISRIVRWDFSDLEREEFAIEYELRAIVGRIYVTLSNQKTSDISAEANGLLGRGESYRQSVRALVVMTEKTTKIDFDNGILRKDGELVPQHPFVSFPSIFVNKVLIILLNWFNDRRLFVPFTATNAGRFDESLDVFRKTWNSEAYPGMIETIKRAFSPLITQVVYHPPGELMVKLETAYQANPALTGFVATQDNVLFMSKAIQAMGFTAAELRLDLLARTGTPDRGSIELGNMIARFFFADGGFITQDRLSYGQKRLLMFYYYLASNPDIVIADELVNGLHHQWITACIDEIGERQAFLTSQNPLLLDYLPFSSAEQVGKSFVRCTSELDENQKPVWTWSNMSEEAATEFYSAYQVGIEHVSEILQSQGLF